MESEQAAVEREIGIDEILVEESHEAILYRTTELAVKNELTVDYLVDSLRGDSPVLDVRLAVLLEVVSKLKDPVPALVEGLPQPRTLNVSAFWLESMVELGLSDTLDEVRLTVEEMSKVADVAVEQVLGGEAFVPAASPGEVTS